MKIDTRHKNSFYSLLGYVGLIGLVSLLPFQTDFAGLGILLLLEIFIIVVGIFYVVMGLFKIKIPKTEFFYNFCGTINLFQGILLLLGFIFSRSISYPVMLILNLIIGGYIYMKIFGREKNN